MKEKEMLDNHQSAAVKAIPPSEANRIQCEFKQLYQMAVDKRNEAETMLSIYQSEVDCLGRANEAISSGDRVGGSNAIGAPMPR